MRRIRRCIEHWQSLPVRNRIGVAVCMAVLIACFVELFARISYVVTGH